jgi:hypothetical protein
MHWKNLALLWTVFSIACDPAIDPERDSGVVTPRIDAGERDAGEAADDAGHAADAAMDAHSPDPDGGSESDGGTIDFGCAETDRYSLGSIFADASSIAGLRISRDGTRVAYKAHIVASASVIVGDIAGTPALELASGLDDNPALAWGVGDAWVYYSGIDRIDSSGAIDTPEPFVRYGTSSIDLSMGGRELIFTGLGLHMYDTRMGEGSFDAAETWVAGAPGRSVQSPRFSPGGLHIAFVQQNADPDFRTSAAELHIFSLRDLAETRTITTAPIRFLADATEIAWTSEHSVYASGEIARYDRLFHLDIEEDAAVVTEVYASADDRRIEAFDVHSSGVAVLAESHELSGATEIVVLRCAP